MRRHRILFTHAMIALLLYSGQAFRVVAAASADVKKSSDIAVVVNPQNTTDDVSMEELKRILLGDQMRWKNKTKISLVLRTTGSRERSVILTKIVQMSEQDFNKWWAAKVFRGEVDSGPFLVPSNGGASAYLDVYPGGVTFIPGADVRRDLKVLKVNGLLPGDADYPLK